MFVKRSAVIVYTLARRFIGIHVYSKKEQQHNNITILYFLKLLLYTDLYIRRKNYKQMTGVVKYEMLINARTIYRLILYIVNLYT